MALATVVVLGAALTAGLVLGFGGRHAARRSARRVEFGSATDAAVADEVALRAELAIDNERLRAERRVRSAARTAALGGRGPGDLLCIVNRVLRDAGDATCIALCLQLPASRPGTVIVAAAGHPLPYVVGPDGLTVAATTGTLLGAMDGGRWPESRVSVAPGDTLVAFTDGLAETPGRAERFGEHRLVELLERADRDPARLVGQAGDALDRFWDGATRDDTLLLAARYGPSDPPAGG